MKFTNVTRSAIAAVGIGIFSLLAVPPASAEAGAEQENIVADELGVRDASVMGAVPDSQESEQPVTPFDPGSGTYCSWSGLWNTSISGVTLGDGWSLLVMRQEACRAAPSTGSIEGNRSVTVLREADAEFICRGSTQYGYGSDRWYRANAGEWFWSGGTSRTRWGGSC